MENLSRLANRPGVQSTLILSKVDGAIIRSTGLLSESLSSDLLSPEAHAYGITVGHGLGTRRELNELSNDNQYENREKESRKTVEEVARMVFSFVTAAGALAEGLEDGDEVKLLRLRTKKYEMVIVPGLLHSLVIVFAHITLLTMIHVRLEISTRRRTRYICAMMCFSVFC